MQRYYSSIQIFRGMLFLCILAFHCNAPYAQFGWGGVEAFFVISSFFLVRKQYGNDELIIAKQFKHRILRLYPPYIPVLLVAALFALLLGKLPYDIVPHLLSLQNFQWMVTGYNSPMQPMTAHTWTLSIEVWTGLIVIMLLRVLSKKQFKVAMYAMLIAGITCRVITAALGINAVTISLCPLAHFDAFACGSLLAITMGEGKLTKRIGLFAVAGAFGIILCIFMIASINNVGFVGGYKLLSSSGNYLNHWFTGNIYLFISLFSTGLLGLLCIHDEHSKSDNHKFKEMFISLGNNSYVLYLFHWPILFVIRHLFGNWVILFIGTLAASIVSNFIFNKLQAIVAKKTWRMMG